jgi:deoxyribonuclease-4
MRIGAHESIAGGLRNAFVRAREHGAKSVQVFTQSARGWHSAPLDEDERRAFRAAARQTGVSAIAHGSYLVNLASEEPVLRERSICRTTDELTRSEQLGARYLVIHPGSHPDERRGLRLVAQGLDEVLSACRGFSARICLEVTAGQGNCLGWHFDHLAELLSRTRRGDRLGVCLDTCHLFAAGYDVSTPRGYAWVMEELEQAVGLARVKCFHLNDCKKPLGCRVDRHEEIGKGTLGLDAFRSLVNDPRFADAEAVLETPHPEHYRRAIRLLESLAGK